MISKILFLLMSTSVAQKANST